ncbi:transmembrane protein 177 [Culex pipiens pallens]|uniref:transmembrane protein 177 n=1 Tax=Culex pipiens pallens TaxID=42434 RepID=UPI0019536101|nr:transmembrane protein 177 [Culex pipiens pallens]
MGRSSRFAFFVTEAGRQWMFYGSTTLAVGLFAGHYMPHTVGISYFKEFVQAYKHGQERELSEKIQKRFERAVQLVDLSVFEKKFVKPFAVFGFDVFNAGSMKSRFGALVGVPTNYEYDSVADIEKEDVIIRGNKINWNSEGGKLLEDCLVVSEDEQVFGMAREILTLNSHKRLIQSMIPTVSWVFTYSVASLVNQRCNFYVRPFSLRCMLYFICGFLGYGIYSFSTDMSEIYFDTSVDKELAKLGPEVVDAGVRFYDKILKKNVAIRKLTGDDYYTAKGNVNYMIRQKAAPLTVRKDFFVTGYKEFVGNAQKS